MCDARMIARRDRTYYVAANHALDAHRDLLLSDPERAMAAFTVSGSHPALT